VLVEDHEISDRRRTGYRRHALRGAERNRFHRPPGSVVAGVGQEFDPRSRMVDSEYVLNLDDPRSLTRVMRRAMVRPARQRSGGARGRNVMSVRDERCRVLGMATWSSRIMTSVIWRSAAMASGPPCDCGVDAASGRDLCQVESVPAVRCRWAGLDVVEAIAGRVLGRGAAEERVLYRWQP
jgi:hypothetical protein